MCTRDIGTCRAGEMTEQKGKAYWRDAIKAELLNLRLLP
jgi:hypothetical protein